MSEWLRNVRIPNLKREKAQVELLYSLNIKLAAFIKAQKFTDIFFWRFEDEQEQLYMDLTDENTESKYW